MRKSPLQHRKDVVRDHIQESLQFVDVLERIYNKTRGQHNTAALLTAAKQHKGLIITHTKKWAKELRSAGADATIYTDPKIWDYQGPVLMDLPCMFEFIKAQARLAHAAEELLTHMDNKGID